MDKQFVKMYEFLVPRDQQVVDIVLGTLYEKQLEIKGLTDHISKMLDDETTGPSICS